MPHNSESLRRAFRYFYPNELPLLKALPYMVKHSPVVVVNIGSGAGTSGLAFLETRQDLILHTVDIQDANSPFGCLYAERDIVRAAGLGRLENVRWFQHHMDSKALAKQWTEPVDCVFIDGDHEYEGATGDILGWLPHIREGGYIAVHDYRKGDILPVEDGPHPMVWDGVDKAVDELLRPNYDCIAHVESLIVFKVE
jgi:predicted O-methyltransferase YrrM